MKVLAEKRTSEHVAIGAVFSASLVVSAYLMSRSMAGIAAPWVGWISLAPLLLTIRCLRPLWAAAAGALWGTSLVAFSAAGGSSVFPLTLTSISLLVSVPAFYTFAGSLLTRSRVGFSPLILGAAWVGVEYALSPLALRYGLLTGGVSEVGVLQAAGGVLGYGFIAFVVAYVNGLLLGLLAKVRIRVPGPLYVPGATDPGARILPEVVPCSPFRGARAARPRAPPTPIW
jgi:hypothetical protein